MTRKIQVAAVVLFAPTMMGANGGGCGFESWSSVEPVPTDSSKPYCQMDPPVGCMATCLDIGNIGFTDQCSDISAGPLTMQFRSAIENLVLQGAALGQTPCTQDQVDSSFSVTPCQTGITPQPNPPESPNLCQYPLTGCWYNG